MIIPIITLFINIIAKRDWSASINHRYQFINLIKTRLMYHK